MYPQKTISFDELAKETWKNFSSLVVIHGSMAGGALLVINAILISLLPVYRDNMNAFGGPPETIDANFFLQIYGATLALALVAFVMDAFFIVRSYDVLENRLPDSAQAAALILRRLLPLLVGGFLMFLILIAGLFLCLIPGIIAAVCLYLMVPLIVLDQFGPIDSIRESIEQTRGNRWQIFFSFLMAIVIGFVVQIPTFVVTFWSESPWLTILVSSACQGVQMTFNASIHAVVFAQIRRLSTGAVSDDVIATFE
ncbi:MAG: hypothetical protein OEV00_00460 [Acidobacteriota bacterium]|nr:hypothetical protein [Acidobacteriota bacterium]MDH3783775.1 hypothetical protein [Acidobacteriota bacterium]